MIEKNNFCMELYRNAPIGMVVLDDGASVVEANELMFRIFEGGRDGFRGKQFGNAFNCSNVAGSEIVCGQGEQCSFCPVRGTISKALESGELVESSEIAHIHRIGDKDTARWFKLSASSFLFRDNRYTIIGFFDLTREKEHEARLNHQLTLDGATGVMNKQSLIESLQCLPGIAGTGESISIGIIDMDDFKKINDNYGHLMGDKVLEEFTRIARESIRSQDIIGRFGGEEFMLVFPGVKIGLAETIIRRIFNSLNDALKGEVEEVSFSAGFVELCGDEIASTSKEDIINQVDHLMYRAKKAGKRRFAFQGGMSVLG